MNKQVKKKQGIIVSRGIEWTDFTSNPQGGCFHGCRWEMPDEAHTMAVCYAETTAEGIAGAAYPQGFEHYYWRPEEMKKWKSLKKGSKVFVGSMTDMFGHWVPEENILEVLDNIRANPQMIAQLLTKNPKRALDFDIPHNAWIGASTPPTEMWGKRLNNESRLRMMRITMESLDKLHSRGCLTWISAEPLNIPLGSYLLGYDYPDRDRPVDWIVIGAASNGRIEYAPEETHVRTVCYESDRMDIAVFFKGNLQSLDWAKNNWREEFPEYTA